MWNHFRQCNVSLVKIDWSLGNWDLWFLVWSKRFCHTHSHSYGVTNSRLLPWSGHLYRNVRVILHRSTLGKKQVSSHVCRDQFVSYRTMLLSFVTYQNNPKKEQTISSLKSCYCIPGFIFTTRLFEWGDKTFFSTRQNLRGLQNEQEDFSFIFSVL